VRDQVSHPYKTSDCFTKRLIFVRETAWFLAVRTEILRIV
jgi:hypothetical protein